MKATRSVTVTVTVTLPEGEREGYVHRWMSSSDDDAMIAALSAEDTHKWPSRPIPMLARLDPDGTAEPLTRIVHHPLPLKLQGPGIPLNEPEYENMFGNRTSLR